MATSGKNLSNQDRDRVRKLREAGLSIREIARAQMLSKNTVQKILQTPLAK